MRLIGFNSFFAGIGGFDAGFEEAGMQCRFQSELNPFRQEVLKKNFPNITRRGDIKEIMPDDLPKSELWCGGFPCQDLSLANQGKRKGLDGDRSGLFFEFHRLLEPHRPKWIVLENVPGLLNSHLFRAYAGSHVVTQGTFIMIFEHLRHVAKVTLPRGLAKRRFAARGQANQVLVFPAFLTDNLTVGFDRRLADLPLLVIRQLAPEELNVPFETTSVQVQV